ncbi:hypothetical protein [Balneola vulgaris]|uniref:hypothetical protein n=1 Tax=Balneola vulgaris TaxID=287535 RepID=UPI0003821C21|nr:hypothetical protein [Balneola vulgaris]
MTPESIKNKIEISYTAIDLYMSTGQVSMKNLIKETGLTASDIYTLFPEKKSILSFYYPSIVYQYRMMISEIDDFDSYTLSEKLSNFIYTSFDVIDEQREFVQKSFYKTILKKGTHSEFHHEISLLIKEFYLSDPHISVSSGFMMGDRVFSFLAKEYLYVVNFWLNDDSEGKEKTFALVDKLTAFLEELSYSKIIDKGFDLTKYLVVHAGLGNRIPIVGDCIKDYFTNKDESSNQNEPTS